MKNAAAFLLFVASSAHAAEFVIGTDIRLESRDARPGPKFADMLAYDLTVGDHSDCDLAEDGMPGCPKFPISFRQLSNRTNPDVPLNSLIVVSNGRTMGGSFFPGWHSAEEGDLFNSREIESGRFGRYLREETILEPGAEGEFYLGVSFDGGFLLHPTTGWARMRSTTEGLELLDNAIFYENAFIGEELGIVIGSFTPIPEPTSFLLMLVGAMLLRRFHILLSPRPVDSANS